MHRWFNREDRNVRFNAENEELMFEGINSNDNHIQNLDNVHDQNHNNNNLNHDLNLDHDNNNNNNNSSSQNVRYNVEQGEILFED